MYQRGAVALVRGRRPMERSEVYTNEKQPSGESGCAHAYIQTARKSSSGSLHAEIVSHIDASWREDLRF